LQGHFPLATRAAGSVSCDTHAWFVHAPRITNTWGQAPGLDGEGGGRGPLAWGRGTPVCALDRTGLWEGEGRRIADRWEAIRACRWGGFRPVGVQGPGPGR